jgi:hypothetical protein
LIRASAKMGSHLYLSVEEHERALVECGLLKLTGLLLSCRTAPVAENLFLCRQLAFFQERSIKPRGSTAGVGGELQIGPEFRRFLRF